MKSLLTRQPIFDAEDQIAGYELFCRGSGAAEGAVDTAAAQRVLVDALLGVGLDRLAEGHIAFVSLTRDLLLGDALRPLLVDRRLHLVEHELHLGARLRQMAEPGEDDVHIDGAGEQYVEIEGSLGQVEIDTEVLTGSVRGHATPPPAI